MKQPVATFCSLALCLWGYQTGLWILAIPMIVALEGREFIRRRWQTSWPMLRGLHLLAGLIWFLSVLLLPPTSPDGLAYAASHQMMRGLPVAFFPLILVQTYCKNVGTIYHNHFRQYSHPTSAFNLYYPYFGICLLAASATGGNSGVFLIAVLGLVAGVLWVTRSPRFSTAVFYGLLVLALLMSLGGAQQYYWLADNVRLPSLYQVGDLIAGIRVGPQDTISPNSSLSKDFEEEVVEIAQGPRSDTSPPDTSGEPSNPSPQTSDGGSSDLEFLPNTSSVSDAVSTVEENAIANGSDTASPSIGDETPAIQPPEQGPNLDGSGIDSASIQPEPTAPSDNVSSEKSRPSSSNASSSTQTSQGPANSSLPQGIQQVGGLIDPETSRTRIGALGSLQQSNAILFHLKPLGETPQAWPYPLRIQETTYNQYRAGDWNAVESKFESLKSRRQTWSIGDHNGSYRAEIIEKVKTQKGYLKLPIGTSTIDQLNVESLKQNQYGAIAFQRDPSSDPLRYQVEFLPTKLVARRPTRQDRQVPRQEKKAIETVLKSLDLDDQADQEKVKAIANFFKQGFEYSLDLPTTPAGQTPLGAFLLDHRSGHCEYYASATSLLLRAAGIPARYVVGYSASEYDTTEQQYIVRLRDAHAWVMAYVNNRWITLDTTPSSGASQDHNGQNTVEEQVAQQTPSINPENTYANIPSKKSDPASTRSSTDSASQSNSGDQSDGNPEPSPNSKGESWLETLANLWSEWMDQLNQLWTDSWSWVQSQYEKVSESAWFGAFLLLGIAIAIGSGIVIWKLCRRPQIQRRWRKRRLIRKTAAAHPVEEKVFTFQDIETRLQHWNLQRNPAETAKQWVSRLEDELSEAQFQGLTEILDLHYRHRFDPQQVDEGDRKQLSTLIQDWLSKFTSPTPKDLRRGRRKVA